MTWYEDLRHLDWDGTKFTILDTIKEEGRVYLGLAPFDEVAAVAEALNAGIRRPLPSQLTWVEESAEGFKALSKREVEQLQARKSARAVAAFRKT